uniref:protein O-mannosyl-transferase family n=1 Tax=Flavobacterium sp. TaxID=239 RepID=UPI00404AB9E4
MTDFDFKKWNTLIGWVSFAIALIVYTMTVEPTVSFWDCGEYISTSAKLELGHPPGAPLFQMLGSFFAMFALENSQVAFMINMMSVLASAFTILFMFWTLTILLQKLVLKNNTSDSVNQQIMILGSAFVGTMAFTFSDSFWYNAVEAEVYAMATFLIALLFWLGFKWEAAFDSPYANKWLLIISLVIGFSFGVHIMALLTIPAISLAYFFKKYKKITLLNFLAFNGIGLLILVLVFKILIPFILEFFGRAEIFVVNNLGLPFNSGTILAFLLIVTAFIYGIKYTHHKGFVHANTIILSVLFIVIGFSSWLMLPIRANANPPINENRPSDAVEMLAYYNRDQYGSNSLLYGKMYTEQFAGLDPETPYLDGQPNYERDLKTGKYVIVNHYEKTIQNLDNAHKGFLPRMWSHDNAANYMVYSGVPNFTIDPQLYGEEGYEELVQIVAEFRAAYNSGRLDEDDYIKFLSAYGNYLAVERPTLMQNISYMFQFQFNYMYFRYLMWNFSGRQNDEQGRGDLMDGNWITGIGFIDNLMLFNQDNLPNDIANNKSRNVYYLIPFLLAVFGIFYQSSKDKRNFYILAILFLFTGLALKVYLNERPFEPRERDYAVVGSFYIFAMWIAFGVYAIYDFLRKYAPQKAVIFGVIGLTLLGAPVLMGVQNWDDHTRAGKYTALASAKGYLDSCDQNAILFTIGDNDTFPLWYAQEIENYRTDVRIVNTQLLMTDWYIDQMKSQAYESAPLPISLIKEQYKADKLEYVFFDQRTDGRWNLGDLIDFIKNDNPKTKVTMNSGEQIPFYPTNKVRLQVDKDTVIKNRVVSEKFYDSIVPFVDINIKGSALYKNRIVMLDLINQNNWERPICFTGGSFSDEDYLWLKDYLQLDGLVYKFVPVKNPMGKDSSPLDMGQIDSEKMYKIVKNWDWGNSDGDIYHDPETRKNSITYRTNLARLTETLIAEQKLDKAKEIIELTLQKMPIDKFGYYTLLEPYIGFYYEVKEPEKGKELFDQLAAIYHEYLSSFSKLNSSSQEDLYREIYTNTERYRGLLTQLKVYDLEKYMVERETFNQFIKPFGRFQLRSE